MTNRNQQHEGYDLYLCVRACVRVCVVPRAHQGVCVAVALRGVFPGSLPGSRVTVEPHVLGAELQQRRPIGWGRRGRPGVGVNHPVGGVLPRSPPTVELKRQTGRKVRI